MAVRVEKPAFNLRNKLVELDRPVGSRGGELLRSNTTEEAFGILQAGRKNMFINGSCQVWQRSTSKSSVSSSGYHTQDRWAFSNHGATSTLSRNTDTPEGQGFNFSNKLQVTTATGGHVGNVCGWYYRWEGQDVQHLSYGTPNAKTMAISFWVRSSRTGQITTTLRHDSVICSKVHKIDVADTWEKKTWIVPADYNNEITSTGNGSSLTFNMYISTDTNTNSGSYIKNWGSFHNAHMAWGNTLDVIDHVNATFYWTGMQCEVGYEATPFEHRPYGEELALCKRYFQKILLQGIASGGYSSASGGYNDHLLSVAYPVELRTTPTLSYDSVGNYQPGGGTGTPSTLYAHPQVLNIKTGSQNSTWQPQVINSGAYAYADAEL